MTTSDAFGGYPPPPPPPPPPGPGPYSPGGSGGPGPAIPHVLRRSRGNRVAAGVSGGLGEYFGVDPVLFRVLFATSAFFGGAGIVAYLLAWAAIPEAGTDHAMIDNWVGALRRRRFPAWLAVIIAAVILWAIAFSWWAPRPFVPVIVVAVVVALFFGRRDLRGAGGPTPPTPVDLTKGAPAGPAPTSDQPSWVRDARSWFDESRAAARVRRRRALPVRVAVLVVLAGTLITLAIADAVSGIALQYYFWATLGIVGLGLLVGLVLRRTPLGLAWLLIPAIIGSVAFAGSHASLADGVGQREWKPTTTLAANYRLGVGQATLDLTALPTPTTPQTVTVRLGAGQVKIIAPRTMNLTVQGNIHVGQLSVDQDTFGHRHGHGGVGISRTVSPPAGASGAPVTVDVHLADGNIEVDHR